MKIHFWHEFFMPKANNMNRMWILLFLFLFPTSAGAFVSEAKELKIKADQLLKQGRIVPAIQLYEKVLEKNRDFANAHYNLATAYFQQGEIKKAVFHLEEFVRLRPHDAEALYNLGCLKLRLGSLEEASKCFRQARDCSSSLLMSQKIREALHFLKDLSRQNPQTQNLFTYLLATSSL